MPRSSNSSKSQIDRSGDRLRLNDASDDDLRLLDAYRNSFRDAYDTVIRVIRSEVSVEPTGREKTNASIIEKLRRQSIRLTQIQDIVGCRIIVLDTNRQNQLVDELIGVFSDFTVDDR